MLRSSAVPLSLLILAANVTFATADESTAYRPRFYAFENGVRFGSYDNEAQTLKQLGYDGISQVHTGGAKLADRIAAYDKVGLRVQSVYLNVNDTPIEAEVVRPLAESRSDDRANRAEDDAENRHGCATDGRDGGCVENPRGPVSRITVSPSRKCPRRMDLIEEA